jgi:hypothetical protein
MRTTHSFIVALLAACGALLHAAPSFASDATAAPGDRVLAMATVVAIALLLLGLGLYCEVASLRPLVHRTGVEARAREEREENARQVVARASADLYAALTELQEQIQRVRVAPSPVEVAAAIADPAGAPASDPPRDTLTMLPPAMTGTPPNEAAGAAEMGNDDPTHVLSREALQQAMAGAGDSQAPRAAMSRSTPAPEPRDAGRRPQVFQRRSPQ